MKNIFHIHWLLTISAFILVIGTIQVSAQSGANVILDTMNSSGKAKYRVEGATGKGQGDAIKTAKLAALEFAARSLAGDPSQKTSAVRYVEHNFDRVKGFTSKGRIYRTGFDDSGENMSINIFITVQNDALKKHLIESGIIKKSRDIAKSVGRPTILVFYSQGDCDKGNSNSPACALPKRIKEATANVEKIENKIMKFQESIVKAGCLIATKRSVDVKHSYRDKSRGSSSYRHSGSGGAHGSYSAGPYHAAGSGGHHYRSRSRAKHKVHINRKSVYSFSAKSIKASKNCRAFMRQINPMTEGLRRAVARRDRMQDKLDYIRDNLIKNDVTTTRINAWLANERWDIVDADAVKKAQRQLDAMTSVEGLPQDPVAATASMVGADIYIEHDFVETHPNGGYGVMVTIKAYDVVSGKLLASKVGRATPLASRALQAEIGEAVGRAMPKVLEQIQGYWSDMAKEGVKARIVLRGDFSDSDLSDTIEGLLMDDLSQEMGRYCGDDNCNWEAKLSTKGTMMGYYVMPMKVRKRKTYARKLRKLLKNEGLSVSKIVDTPNLQVMEIQN